MKKLNLKTTETILCNRILEEKFIMFSLITCFLIVILYHLISKEGLLSNFSCLIDFLTSYNTEILGLAVSYIAGTLFYVLTVLVPYARNSRVILPDIIEELRYLKDDFRELSGVLCDGDWMKDIKLVKKAVDDITQRGNESGSGYIISDFHQNMMKDYMKRIDDRILYVQSHSIGYLDDAELELLLKIKRSEVLEHLREYNKHVYSVLNLSEINKLILDIEEIKRQEFKLYEDIHRRIFKDGTE